MTIISKELLSVVLENEVPYEVKVHKIIVKNNTLNYFYNSKDSMGGLFEANEYINIYELTSLKCKEWALSKGYYLGAEQGINYKDNLQWVCFLNTDMDDGADYVDYWNNTEPEALIKACEWLLNKNIGE